MKTTLSKPTPVRLHESTRPRLEAVARKFRLSPSAIIRLAVDDKIEQLMRSGTLKIEASH